ncbi:MAG: hypothetical protein AAF368_04745 [Planctomycetota bacterium]
MRHFQLRNLVLESGRCFVVFHLQLGELLVLCRNRREVNFLLLGKLVTQANDFGFQLFGLFLGAGIG